MVICPPLRRDYAPKYRLHDLSNMRVFVQYSMAFRRHGGTNSGADRATGDWLDRATCDWLIAWRHLSQARIDRAASEEHWTEVYSCGCAKIGGQSKGFRPAVPVAGKVMLFSNIVIRFEVVDDFHDAELQAALVRTADVQNGLEYIC
jgi:hypothetical protein